MYRRVASTLFDASIAHAHDISVLNANEANCNKIWNITASSDTRRVRTRCFYFITCYFRIIGFKSIQ